MADNPLDKDLQKSLEIKNQTISGDGQQFADQIINQNQTVIYNFGYFLYKFFTRSKEPKTPPQPLPSAIKGLMAFTDEDGELFLKLERGNELAQLKNYLFDPQIGLLVMMGESGAGKTSLLRAGLSHLLKDKDCRYVYWEARPTEAVAGLLKSIQQGLGVEVKDLTALLMLTTPVVIVLDQFEQLLPDKAEFATIFNLLKAVSLVPPPYKITWIVAFRREYAADWLDFETQLDEQFKFSHSQRLSLKLFSEAQARNVMATLANSAGLSLEPPLLDAFINSVHRDKRLSPVDIGIGLLMLQELAVEKKQPKLSLADYQFAGGSQGLFVLFLTNKIEQRFDNKREQEAFFEALLELVDLNNDQRIAEGKSFVELSAKAKGLKEQALESALNYFASGQVRLLEKIVRADGCKAYRLLHESMIPVLRELGKFRQEKVHVTIKIGNDLLTTLSFFVSLMCFFISWYHTGLGLIEFNITETKYGGFFVSFLILVLLILSFTKLLIESSKYFLYLFIYLSLSFVNSICNFNSLYPDVALNNSIKESILLNTEKKSNINYKTIPPIEKSPIPNRSFTNTFATAKKQIGKIDTWSVILIVLMINFSPLLLVSLNIIKIRNEHSILAMYCD